VNNSPSGGADLSEPRPALALALPVLGCTAGLRCLLAAGLLACWLAGLLVHVRSKAVGGGVLQPIWAMKEVVSHSARSNTAPTEKHAIAPVILPHPTS
jgi:hypothetical protein